MDDEQYWAGSASLRFEALEVVRGFAQLVIHSAGETAEAWSGLFFSAGRVPGLRAGAAAELLLPGDFIGRALVGEDADGMYSLDGVLPWPDWRTFVTGEDRPPDHVVMFERAGFIETRGPARMTRENWVPIDDLPPFPKGQRMLLDYRQVKEILVPFEWFLDAARKLDARGLKVAVVASSQMAFGLGRQTILTAGLDEGRTFAVFRNYEEARIWLLANE